MMPDLRAIVRVILLLWCMCFEQTVSSEECAQKMIELLQALLEEDRELRPEFCLLEVRTTLQY